MTLDELRLKHGVDERTARRDINTLQEVGLPIVEEEGPDRRKRWRIAFRDKLQEIAILTDVSLYFALRQGSALRGTPIFTDAEDLGDKLLDFISGKDNREFLLELDNCFYSPEKHAYKEARIDVIWPLAMAIIKKREVVVTYQKESGGEFKNHTVLPLKLMVHNGAVHLVHTFKGKRRWGSSSWFASGISKVLKTTGERPTEQAIQACLTRGFGLSPAGQ